MSGKILGRLLYLLVFFLILIIFNKMPLGFILEITAGVYLVIIVLINIFN